MSSLEPARAALHYLNRASRPRLQSGHRARALHSNATLSMPAGQHSIFLSLGVYQIDRNMLSCQAGMLWHNNRRALNKAMGCTVNAPPRSSQQCCGGWAEDDVSHTQEEYIKEEQRSLKRELLRAQEEVKRIQAVPLVIGQFLEAVDATSGIVGSTTGSNYYVRLSKSRLVGPSPAQAVCASESHVFRLHTAHEFRLQHTSSITTCQLIRDPQLSNRTGSVTGGARAVALVVDFCLIFRLGCMGRDRGILCEWMLSRVVKRSCLAYQGSLVAGRAAVYRWRFTRALSF